MSESEEMWQAIERHAVSSVTGVRAEDDDALLSDALIEAPMNPHKGASAPSGMGGPAMMPPMMMGGMGGGQAGGAGSAGAASSLATGGGGVGAASSSAQAAGLSTHGISAAASLRAAPPPETATGGVGGGGGGAPSGGGSGLGAASSLPTGGGAAAEEAEEDLTEEETEPAEEGQIESVGTAPENSSTAPAPEAPRDGFTSNPEAVLSTANAWGDLKDRLAALDQVAAQADLGLILAAERPQQAVNDSVAHWLEGAAKQLDVVQEQLRATVEGYEEVDDEAVAAVRKELVQ